MLYFSDHFVVQKATYATVTGGEIRQTGEAETW